MISPNWLEERLDVLLEDALAVDKPVDASDPASKMMSMYAELDDIRKNLAAKEREYKNAMDGLNAHLAMAIRRTKPGLNIALEGSGCKIGYRSKYITLTPNPSIDSWEISAPAKLQGFVNGIKRFNAGKLALTSDVNELAKGISEYFSIHYKSLGEDIQGTGVILKEGKRLTSLSLAGLVAPDRRYDPEAVSLGIKHEMMSMADPTQAMDLVKSKLQKDPLHYHRMMRNA